MRIRKYNDSDFECVRKIIHDTYFECCFQDGSKKAVKRYIGDFDSKEDIEKSREKYKKTPIAFVAEIDNKVVGFVRGKKDKMTNLFVLKEYHKRGIARKLFEKFEKENKKLGSDIIRIKASLYAVPFYQKMGFRKTTGIRKMNGLKYQPMKKILV